ncbi:MAG: tRNA glutamyl-Q(34) synthetase GluQRS [Bdellovibrio sp.]|nr:tRNA glutamyl-Q(34) synthetase GluQRS [Methylotenera sp.]
MHYIGRFAPSPTGPLHFGSLVAAVASYCDAKSNGGQWLVRIEDLDTPREVAGAADTILRSLEAFGFEWDAPVIYQSQRAAIYHDYLHALKATDLIYACTCSRKEITDSSIISGLDGPVYPKTCINKKPHKLSSGCSAPTILTNACSWRINVADASTISFVDGIQGELSQHLPTKVGDFILKRKDGIFAYQLAVVVDDALQNITHIVRGADLLESTPRQIYLRNLLNFILPSFAPISYAHVPVACNAAGEKLSKQTLAKPIDTGIASHLMVEALSFLGQMPPADLKNARLAECWLWAIKHWNLESVTEQTQIKIIE